MRNQKQMNRGNDHEQSSGLLSLRSSSQQRVESNREMGNDERMKGDENEVDFQCSWAFWMFLLFSILVTVIVSRYYFPFSSVKLDGEQVNNISTLISIYQHLNEKSQKQQDPSVENKKQQSHLINIEKEYPKEVYEKFSSPYTLWLFVSSNPTQKDYIHNIEHYTSPSKSNVQLVTMENYHDFIKSSIVLKTLEKVKNLSLTLQQKQQLIQHLIVFCLLEQNGGIAIGGDLVLTQQLDKNLIDKIQQHKHTYKLFSFIDHNNDQSTIDIDLLNYFIASGKHFDFMAEFVQRMTQALQNEISTSSPSSQNLLKRYQQHFNELILFKFQTYSSSKQNKDQTNFLDYLQFYSLGSLESLHIAKPYLLDMSNPNLFQFLSSYEEQAMEELVGELNPIVHLPSNSYSFFLNQIKTSQNHPILQNSFLYRHMLSFSSTYSTIKPLNPEADSQKYSSWKVPKTLWTFINKINEKSSLQDYFIANLIENAKNSGFQLLILTQETIQAVLDQKEIHQIFSYFKNLQAEQNQAQNQKILSLLIKLFVLKKYGGIFVDFGYFLLQNLNWIPLIRSNDHVFNNMEAEPQVFIFHKNQVSEWSVNLNSGVKTVHNLHYMTEFIAATKNNKLITDWLEILLKSFKSQMRQNSKKDETHCQLDNFDWKFLDEVSLECVFEIQKQSGQPLKAYESEYNIWSISNLLGGEKMNLVMKEEHIQCFDFKDTLSKFKSQFGSLGYISELTTDVSKKQLDQNLSNLPQDSIFQQFFVQKNVSKKEIEQKKSLAYVTVGIQKLNQKMKG